MTHRLAFHVRAREDLFSLFDYIEKREGPQRAGEYVGRIERKCRALETFTHGGRPRDDVLQGIRTIAMERRVLIAYRVSSDIVEILRVLYGGRDFSTDDLPT